jgi:DNA-binding MarR family transcriptional regulator
MRQPSSCACTNLRRAARAITQFYDRNLEPVGLKVTQFSLLRSVLRAGATSISALAEEVRLDRTTLGRNLAVLEGGGLVALSPGKDQRERTVTLTASGKRALDSAIPLWEQAQHKVTKALGRNGLNGLTSLLVKVEAFA